MDERRLIPPGHGESRGPRNVEPYCACGRPLDFTWRRGGGRCACGRIVPRPPGTRCPHCDGLGFMAGAHTEGVNPCPYCDGSGAAG